jgi:4-hydroxy-2-oxoheptanedioate aldolase
VTDQPLWGVRRPGRMLEKLRSGQPAYMSKMNLRCPETVQVIASAGFDGVWICREHTPSTLAEIRQLVMACRAFGLDSIVRVPRGSYSDLVHPLEMDADAIMVPHVMDPDDARAVIRQTKFQPIGLRPVDGGNPDGDFCEIPPAEYAELANRNRMVILQIEDPSAVESVDEIAAIEGVDMLFYGPGDYSHALGIIGQMDDPRIDQARRKVAEACAKAGVFAGTVASLQNYKEYLDMGYQFMNLGADVRALVDYYKQFDLGSAAGENKSIYG